MLLFYLTLTVFTHLFIIQPGNQWACSNHRNGSCCCSITQSCPTLCNPMDCSIPGSSVLHCFPEFAQTHVHWVSDKSNHLILCRPLLPSIFPSIRVFSNESALSIRWPKYWSFSFSFSINPSNEYSVLIFFRMDWLDLAVQGQGASHPRPSLRPLPSSDLCSLG